MEVGVLSICADANRRPSTSSAQRWRLGLAVLTRLFCRREKDAVIRRQLVVFAGAASKAAERS